MPKDNGPPLGSEGKMLGDNSPSSAPSSSLVIRKLSSAAAQHNPSDSPQSPTPSPLPTSVDEEFENEKREAEKTENAYRMLLEKSICQKRAELDTFYAGKDPALRAREEALQLSVRLGVISKEEASKEFSSSVAIQLELMLTIEMSLMHDEIYLENAKKPFEEQKPSYLLSHEAFISFLKTIRKRRESKNATSKTFDETINNFILEEGKKLKKSLENTVVLDKRLVLQELARLKSSINMNVVLGNPPTSDMRPELGFYLKHRIELYRKECFLKALNQSVEEPVSDPVDFRAIQETVKKDEAFPKCLHPLVDKFFEELFPKVETVSTRRHIF